MSEMDEYIAELRKLGFKLLGKFHRFFLEELSPMVARGVYAFVVGGKVKYVGETKQTLKARMNLYLHGTQPTNTRVRENLLLKSEEVEVWFLPDSNLRQSKIQWNNIAIVPDRKLIERFLLVYYNPEFNRG